MTWMNAARTLMFCSLFLFFFLRRLEPTNTDSSWRKEGEEGREKGREREKEEGGGGRTVGEGSGEEDGEQGGEVG